MMVPAAHAALEDAELLVRRLAASRMLPEAFGRRHSRFGTATRAIDLSAAVTVLIIASAEVVSVASVALVVALVLLVGAFDYAIFANIDKVAKRLRPTSLVISEVVFGILLTAVAVQLVVTGLNLLGIIATPGAEH